MKIFKKKIKLVIDESFVDFSDCKDSTIISQKIIEANPHLYVVKSISKSYGVPGVRLGILVSSDIETIAFIKRDVSIWNINSFGEFYMQIAEKYKKDYATALERFRVERIRFMTELKAIDKIRVLPSQANFLMIELTGELTAKQLTKKLLLEHNILIKDLSKKVSGEYIRIAIRSTEDNDRLINAFKLEIC